MARQFEVYIEADTPWTTGQREAVKETVLTFCECNTQEVNASYERAGFGFDDADQQIASYCGDDYAGYGGNVRGDADQYVFNRLECAERFAGLLRENCRHLGMTIKVWELE